MKYIGFLFVALAAIVLGTLFVSPGNIHAGVGTPNVVKTPRLSNLWLCQPVASCADPSNGIGERDLEVRLDTPIISVSPKGERQTIGSFEFQVRYDAKFVSVTVDPGPLFRREDASCSTIPGQGFVSFRCNIKGKPADASVGPGVLAIVRVRATADVYSMLIPNQDNGIATQLINQGCQLSDLQGHPIVTTLCSDAELTIRYLEGDLNADCVVNVQDQQLIAYRWGSRVGSLLYNSRYDLEPAAPKKGDGDVDAKDLQVVFGRHDSTCTEPWPAQLPVDPKALPAFAVNLGTFVGTIENCGVVSTDTVNAIWDGSTGNPAPSIFLEKTGPTADCSAAFADIKTPLEGGPVSAVTELNFDVKNGGHCNNGSPRFNLQLNIPGPNNNAFLGCNFGGTQTNLGNGWTHVEFSSAQIAAAVALVGLPTDTLTDLYIIVDEGSDLLGYPTGTVNIDNISVNGDVVGSP